MKRPQEAKRKLVLMAIAISLLAASVLAWGTEYKLSLYRARQRESRTHVPRAELLCEKQRLTAAKWVDAHPAIQASAAAFTLWLFLALIYGWRRGERIQILRLRSYAASRRIACLGRFSFRPPPAVAC